MHKLPMHQSPRCGAQSRSMLVCAHGTPTPVAKATGSGALVAPLSPPRVGAPDDAKPVTSSLYRLRSALFTFTFILGKP